MADGRLRVSAPAPACSRVRERDGAERLAGDEVGVCLLALLLLACACGFLRLEFGDGAGVLGALEETEVCAGVVEPGDVLPFVVDRDAGCEDDVADGLEQ